MALRKGEAGLVNRHSYLDNIALTAHQLEADIRFYEEEYADREVLAREFFNQRNFKKAYVMYFDKMTWKKRIKQAKKAKDRLHKLNRMASSWL